MFQILGLILIILILFMLLAIAYLVFRLVQWGWKITTGNGSRFIKAMPALGVFVILSSLFGWYHLADRRFTMDRLPAGVTPTKVDYRNEVSWGIGGPGDNESGLIVYQTEVVRDMAMFDKIEGGESWSRTPVGQTGDRDRWRGTGEAAQPKSDQRYHITSYLGKYGFSIDTPVKITSEVDEVINASGSYYRFKPGGVVVIVSPSRRKAYYAYAG